MKKSDFHMMCEECGSNDIVIYHSIIKSMIGYYCPECGEIYMFDEYPKLDSHNEDLERLRNEYAKK
ncbi:hypothetical protein [Desulfosporosinus metallidurans]|nr:hypothetical protein [Desulfosporosinus metallidurans]